MAEPAISNVSVFQRKAPTLVRPIWPAELMDDAPLPPSGDGGAKRASANTAAMKSLAPGETVVDVGCGSGHDVLAAARIVGSAGRVIGIDNSPEKVEQARRDACAAGISNVTFYLCRIDSVPVPANSVDCIMSHGAINGASNKPAIFREMHRVLRPGGRVMISDVALKDLLPADVAEALIDCVDGLAGAVEISTYRTLLQAAGFEQILIAETGASLSFNSSRATSGTAAAMLASYGIGLATRDSLFPQMANDDGLEHYAAVVRVYAVRAADAVPA
ncbi:MAG: methyltransferase domain-containing protein [Phycisphaerales bacterium]|nr:methyltransferase domain-containing protein [Phycisphaerales bacterium]